MARKAYRDGYVVAHISNTVASQITKLRTANGWTQTQLADHAGMKQSRISALEDPNWENVEIATLRRLASVFDVGLTVRFAPFSDLAQWAAVLSEDKLLVPTYEEEAGEEIIRARSANEMGAAAAFFASLNQQPFPHGSVYDEIQITHSKSNFAPLPKREVSILREDDLPVSALTAGAPFANQNERPRRAAA